MSKPHNPRKQLIASIYNRFYDVESKVINFNSIDELAFYIKEYRHISNIAIKLLKEELNDESTTK